MNTFNISATIKNKIYEQSKLSSIPEVGLYVEQEPNYLGKKTKQNKIKIKKQTNKQTKNKNKKPKTKQNKLTNKQTKQKQSKTETKQKTDKQNQTNQKKKKQEQLNVKFLTFRLKKINVGLYHTVYNGNGQFWRQVVLYDSDSDSDLFSYICGHRPIILTRNIINLDKD